MSVKRKKNPRLFDDFASFYVVTIELKWSYSLRKFGFEEKGSKILIICDFLYEQNHANV